MSMDPERLADLSEGLDDNRASERPVPHDLVCELLADRDNLAREVKRLAACFAGAFEEAERLRGERDHAIGQRDYAAGAIKRLQIHLTRRTAYAQRLKGERDAAQHEALRWAARDRIGQRHPGEAAVKHTAACLAAERGWDHLKFEADAPEGEQPRMPDPLDMHGACDEFGGSDFP